MGGGGGGEIYTEERVTCPVLEQQDNRHHTLVLDLQNHSVGLPVSKTVAMGEPNCRFPFQGWFGPERDEIILSYNAVLSIAYESPDRFHQSIAWHFLISKYRVLSWGAVWFF